MMTEDILPNRRYRTLAWIAGIVACFMLAGVGAAGAALNYDSRKREVVLPGVSIGGVALGGLDFEEARSRLQEEFARPLLRPLLVEAGGRPFLTTAAHLGASTNALQQFNEAVRFHGGLNPARRIWYRTTQFAGIQDLPVKTSIGEKELSAYIEEIASQVDRAPTDASLSLVEGELKITNGESGFKLDATLAVKELRATILSGGGRIDLSGNVTRPATGLSDIKDVLVVKTGENKLYHYRGADLVKVYGVATGTSRYPTPRGQFKIVNKRFRPTWVNPAKYPGGWGASLPARIGPGPGNPLGTRALDLSVGGIRIHGTYAGSSIGYNASHGCIRMHIKDVEELFGLVDVGTPVLIAQSGPFRNLGSRAPSTPEPTAESDGTAVPGQPAPTQPAPSPSPTA